MTFKDLGLIEPLLKALDAEGYTHPTPIQEKAIPILLQNKDLLGCAQTGTGKTAAFTLPILQHLYSKQDSRKGHRAIRALVVTPTRELAIQIGDSITAYGKHTGLRNTVIFGGVKQGAQVTVLKRGIDILVATPGRLLDLMSQGYISLRDIDFFVLDEADQMLDMGFVHDIKKLIAKLPKQRQSLFFSATMPPAIVELSGKILGQHESITIKPEKPTAEKVEQAVYFVQKKGKPKLLTHVLQTNDAESVLVFSRTKHGADKIVRILNKANITAEAIHGNKSQNARQRALGNFKNGETRVLVATDIAARGIDVSGLELVINYDTPNVSETYVHRIGRTGRAKASGVALTFADDEERAYIRDIQKLIKQTIPVITEHPLVGFVPDPSDKEEARPPRQPRQQRSSKPKPRSGSGGGGQKRSSGPSSGGGGNRSTNSSGGFGNRSKSRRPPKRND